MGTALLQGGRVRVEEVRATELVIWSTRDHNRRAIGGEEEIGEKLEQYHEPTLLPGVHPRAEMS